MQTLSWVAIVGILLLKTAGYLTFRGSNSQVWSRMNSCFAEAHLPVLQLHPTAVYTCADG